MYSSEIGSRLRQYVVFQDKRVAVEQLQHAINHLRYGYILKDFEDARHVLSHIPLEEVRQLHTRVCVYPYRENARYFGSVALKKVKVDENENVHSLDSPSIAIHVRKREYTDLFDFIPNGKIFRSDNLGLSALYLFCIDAPAVIDLYKATNRQTKLLCGTTNAPFGRFLYKRMGFHVREVYRYVDLPFHQFEQSIPIHDQLTTLERSAQREKEESFIYTLAVLFALPDELISPQTEQRLERVRQVVERRIEETYPPSLQQRETLERAFRTQAILSTQDYSTPTSIARYLSRSEENLRPRV
ncbi:hypothetical protein C5B42_02030 [Candidatus Cerribacteria bacterium 'Amazon FNV 2010 28 9']|uniref:Uncharacterized protein n=1 Tax=Candidatus Cerribacteria bacterium 'Amazon FNV 2010 28 9' TaxID=2081795 RepID=A0A317JPP8_9BACT|nr:MAG: hypothetical protein C5B42_02030 [Candidatus Cerribacteria bacterium 'Amazon FNV 2010 28 9']